MRPKIERFFWRDFWGEEFRKSILVYNFVHINWLWSGFIHPRIRTFVEKCFHSLFSKKKVLGFRKNWSKIETKNRFFSSFSVLSQPPTLEGVRPALRASIQSGSKQRGLVRVGSAPLQVPRRASLQSRRRRVSIHDADAWSILIVLDDQ